MESFSTFVCRPEVNFILGLVMLGLLVYVAYEVSHIGQIAQQQNMMAVHIAGNSVALGVLCEQSKCHEQVIARLNMLTTADNNEQ